MPRAKRSAAPQKSKKTLKKKDSSLSVAEHGLEAILGAAYLMTDRAWVALDGDKKRVTVTLTPKDGKTTPAALEAEFRVELETQKVRWEISKRNQPIREYVAEQAVRLANEPSPAPAAEPAADQLSDDQKAEIAKLIAEVEDEIKAVKAKKLGADPKNIKASWEEKQESRRGPQA